MSDIIIPSRSVVMTSKSVTEVILEILSDLSRELEPQQRCALLLTGVCQAFPCDAAALLQLQGSTLVPLAVTGLSDDTLGRRFSLDHEPRLARILLSREPIRFAADSPLPDPYDGLIDTGEEELDVHDCLGEIGRASCRERVQLAAIADESHQQKNEHNS